MPKISRHRGITPGRHHFGTPGDIISECLGEFVGIRIFGRKFDDELARRCFRGVDLAEIARRRISGSQARSRRTDEPGFYRSGAQT
jgi:hypothetical protein